MLSLLLILLVVISIVIRSYGDFTIDSYNIQLNNVFSSNDAYVVLYYMGDDEQSKNFGSLMENMKVKLDSYGIKIGAVDCAINKKECKSVNLMSMPSIQLYVDDPVPNPYTKKNYRAGIFFDTRTGPNDLKELERFINKNYPNKILKTNSIDKLSEYNTPSAIFFSERKVSSSPMLLKSIAYDFRNQINVIQFDASENSEDIKTKYKIDEFPQLLVIDYKQENHYYNEDLKNRNNIVDWLKQFAKTKESKEKTSKSNNKDEESNTNSNNNKSNNEDTSIKSFSSSEFSSLSLLSNDDAWILAVTKSGASKEIDNWSKHVQACEGHIKTAEITCNDDSNNDKLGGKLCSGKLPFIVQIPYGDNNRKKLDENEPLKWKRYIYESNEVDDARKEAGESLPESAVIEINEQIFEGVVSNGHNNNKVTVIVVSDKSNASPMLRNLALSLKEIAQVGLLANPSAGFVAQIGSPKLPTVIFGSFVTEINEKTKQSENKIQLMAWDFKVYGPLRFNSISGITYSYYMKSGLGESSNGNNVDIQTTTDRQKELIVLETEDDWTSSCGENYRGICAIGFVPSGSEGDNGRLVLNQVLESLSAVSALKFLIIDAGCQREFAETFFIQSSDLPSITAYSPSKSRYVNFKGSFSSSSAREFLESVIHGRKATTPISTRPKVSSKCDLNNDIPIIEETEEDASDFLAEIKKEEEERKKRLKQEIEEEAKRKKLEEEEALKNKDKKKKKKKKKSKSKSEL